MEGVAKEEAESDKPQSLERVIGNTIRRARTKRGLSIHQLAKSAGISVSMLSRIENGHTSASLSTLNSLANALGISLANLFHDSRQSHESTFVKAGHGLVVQRHDNPIGHKFQLLGHAFHSEIAVEPYLITLTEEAEKFPAIVHEGIEFIYMIEGQMIYQEGDRTYDMCAGDSLYFDPSAPHGPVRLVKLPVVMLTVISAIS